MFICKVKGIESTRRITVYQDQVWTARQAIISSESSFGSTPEPGPVEPYLTL